MLGPRQVVQGALFYEFSIEDHVPADHLQRSIDRFVDLSDIRRFLAPYYSLMGRPSVDPELMIRMLIVGYCFGIRSKRQLCEEVHLNLAYKWFCRLDLGDPVPDHSTFSKNRHGRFRDSDLLRHLFERVLERCIAEGLVGGDSFGVDASLIKGDASRYQGEKVRQTARKSGCWRVEIVRRSKDAEGFVVIAKRWIVERTFAWISRNRRLARDFESLARTAAALVSLAMIKIMLRRLART